LREIHGTSIALLTLAFYVHPPLTLAVLSSVSLITEAAVTTQEVSHVEKSHNAQCLLIPYDAPGILFSPERSQHDGLHLESISTRHFRFS
jgi:hypothetical protein